MSKEFDTGAVMTQICLPTSGRALFVASETGTIRSYNYPLTGQFTEYQAHAGPIARLRISFDDAMLFCVSDDGALFVFDVREKDGRAKLGKEAAVVFAEEVLVTRSDLEEKKARMADLETQVRRRPSDRAAARRIGPTIRRWLSSGERPPTRDPKA